MAVNEGTIVDSSIPIDPTGPASNSQVSTGNAALLSPTSSPETQQKPEEQPLESHEVIELQTFSERKAWIEEKIKFLEKMPPIEVFVGLDAIRSSAEEVPGLPTRDELNTWITEHDAIEKETEIFDTGELAKLRQLTKAAAQRNLSPEDTDLIEITLTTIYALDKLLHLLRDRSENLELLGLRLDWEELRIGSWVDRRKILGDLGLFLETRARWTPQVYENAVKAEDVADAKRRGSVTSVASAASDSSATASGFSRSTRFKLAELLSRDAAQFAARVIALRHSKISPAGKIIDKLIEHSRKRIPDELLDEQEKLEAKGIDEMEHIGKFLMNLIMQWRKADELYVETMKDKTVAQNLLEEIETASLHHPTARQSASFVTRTEGLMKRLNIRGDPALASSSFPFPEHPLFADQQVSNASLVEFLSSEIKTTIDLAQKVDMAAKTYRSVYEKVKKLDNIAESSRKLVETLHRIIDQIKNGVTAGDGDGSPPTLESEDCLEPSRHSAFLALFPAIVEECSKAAQSSDQLLSAFQPLFVELDLPSISSEFRENAAALMSELISLKDRALITCAATKQRAACLKDARRYWISISGISKELDQLQRHLAEAIKTHSWSANHDAQQNQLLTPESSPPAKSPPPLPSLDIPEALESIRARVGSDIDAPLLALFESFDVPLKHFLLGEVSDLRAFLDALSRGIHLFESVKQQNAAMSIMQDEYNALFLRIEDLRSCSAGLAQLVLTDRLERKTELDFESDVSAIEREVREYVDSMATRVPLVEYQSKSGLFRRSSIATIVGVIETRTSTEPPFDLISLNNAVRSDANTFTMKLNGRLENLSQSMAYLRLAHMAKDVDSAASALLVEIKDAMQEIDGFKAGLSSLDLIEGDVMASIASTSAEFGEKSSARRTRLTRSLSQLRVLLQNMETAPGAHITSEGETLCMTRWKAVDDAERALHRWEDQATAFKDDLAQSQRSAEQRQAQLQREEEERIAADEAERLLRQQQEERRVFEEQRAAELRRQEEKEKAAAEEAEKVRLERLRLEEEKTLLLEEERKKEEMRIQDEKDRVAAREAERAQLLRERMEMEEKLRSVEEQLDEERRAKKAKGKVKEEKQPADEPTRQLKGLVRSKDANHQSRKTGDDFHSRKAVHKREGSKATLHTELMPKRGPGVSKTPNLPSSSRLLDSEDVFNLRVAPAESQAKTEETKKLQAQILALRKRLRSLSINEYARPSKSSHNIPNRELALKLSREFAALSREASSLPPSVDDVSVDTELRSLRMEVRSTVELMKRIERLAEVSEAVALCDAALSDLLEHVDSYPALPPEALLSPHKSDPEATPVDQLSARLAFTRKAIDTMSSGVAKVANDSRAVGEKKRILQTFSELEDMCNDRLGEKKSRPSSSISSKPSSSRGSSSSLNNARSSRKSGSYSNLALAPSSSQKRLNIPAIPAQATPRRAVSGSTEDSSRSNSRMSAMSCSRSVSGPFRMSVYGSTFASRQRTASVTNADLPSSRRTPLPSRKQTGGAKRVGSPTPSDASSHAHSTRGSARSSTSMSTWARAPRNSLSSILPKVTTPPKQSLQPRKTYIADPKNKLDVAVGDVINKLPVGIHVEGVSETWKDQSGKYWIGNQDPKLCFCRILRSQTVMVRVGGGWTELSKFIKEHFADSFRLLSASPPRSGTTEERWISSANLLEAAEHEEPPAQPRTPEPTFPFVPSFSLLTPSGHHSPQSLKSHSPSVKGSSPLTPLQFMRRADSDAHLRPVTPSKSPRAASPHIPTTPMRNPVWRP